MSCNFASMEEIFHKSEKCRFFTWQQMYACAVTVGNPTCLYGFGHLLIKNVELVISM